MEGVYKRERTVKKAQKSTKEYTMQLREVWETSIGFQISAEEYNATCARTTAKEHARLLKNNSKRACQSIKEQQQKGMPNY